jgi:hypothetical protein
MEPSPPREPANRLVTQEFPKILRNPKVHYRVPTAARHRFLS